jgi:hypothetical protein
MKSLYGRCAATAEKKAKALFTYGLCNLFSLMIQHEEKMFKESFALAIGLKKPVVPLEEEFQTPEEFEKAKEKYMTAMQKFTQKREQEIRATLDGGVMPPGVTGLVPDGSTKVDWRWMGDIFEDDAQDILNNSIVVRNLQELGVDSIEALKYLFPSKTDEERAAMLSGYPFRMVQQTQQSINSFISLLGQLYQLPHPQTPELPLASDPNLDITGFLYRSLEFLRKELSYSGKYNPDSSDERPPSLDPADERRAASGQPVRNQPVTSLAGISGPGAPNAGLPGIGPGAAGFSPSGQSMAAGVPGAQRKSEYKQPVPGPGITLSVPSNANTPSSYTSQLGLNAPSSAAASPVFGAADLLSPSFNPGANAAGTATAGGRTGSGSGRKSGSGTGRVSKSNQRRKS